MAIHFKRNEVFLLCLAGTQTTITGVTLKLASWTECDILTSFEVGWCQCPCTEMKLWCQDNNEIQNTATQKRLCYLRCQIKAENNVNAYLCYSQDIDANAAEKQGN